MERLGDSQKAMDAYHKMIEQIDYFTEVQKLAEGQYKFVLPREIVYVVWDEDVSLIDELSQMQNLDVTNIYGESSEISGGGFELRELPAYIKIK